MGAIIALFCALGLHPDNIKQTIIKVFTEDRQIRDALRRYEKILESTKNTLSKGESPQGTRKFPRLGPINHTIISHAVGRLWNRNELYSAFEQGGVSSSQILSAALRQALQANGIQDEPTWDAFRNRDIAFKVVATDLAAKRAVIFPDHDSSISVVDAVVASAAYPTAFAPHRHQNRLFADGGISSNTPAFLFNSEAKDVYGRTVVYTLDGSEGPVRGDLIDILGATLSSALSASDALLPTFLGRLIQVRIPENKKIPIIGTKAVLDKNERKQSLENILQQACADARNIAEYQLVQDDVLKQTRFEKQWDKRAAVEYRPREEWLIIFGLIRESLAKNAALNKPGKVPEFTEFLGYLRKIRCCLFVPKYTGQEYVWDIVHHEGFTDEDTYFRDVDNELYFDAPGAAEAAQKKVPVKYNLYDLREQHRIKPNAEGVDERREAIAGTLRKVPEDRRIGVAVPVFRDRQAWDEPDPTKRPNALGILAADTHFQEPELFNPKGPQQWAFFQKDLIAASMAASRLLGG